MQKIVLLLIRFYQILISPFLGSQCKFYPCCSLYAKMAIKEHGVLIGSIKSISRIFRCNPFSKGGVDFP